jgi:hypothetical protein
MFKNSGSVLYRCSYYTVLYCTKYCTHQNPTHISVQLRPAGGQVPEAPRGPGAARQNAFIPIKVFQKFPGRKTKCLLLRMLPNVNNNNNNRMQDGRGHGCTLGYSGIFGLGRDF